MELKGMKGILTGVGVVALIGVSLYYKLSPRSLGKGTWTIGPGEGMIYSIEATKPGKLRALFTPETPGNQYSVNILDEAAHNQLESPTLTNPASITPLAHVEGSGSTGFQEVFLNTGKFYILVENEGKTPLNLKYEIYEIRK